MENLLTPIKVKWKGKEGKKQRRII